MLYYGKPTVKNIHNAIDAIAQEAQASITDQRNQAENQKKKELEISLGIAAARKVLHDATGKDYTLYGGPTDDSPMGSALLAITKPFDARLVAIEKLARDAHISVVTGDKADIIQSLRDALAKL